MRFKERSKKKSKKLFIFSVRTLYEAFFYCEIINYGNINSVVLSFNQEASEHCKKKKIKFINIFNKKNNSLDLKKINKIAMSKIFHEKNEFSLQDTTKLKTKYLNYYNQIRKKIDILNLKFDIYVFQEIGGFVSHLSLFYYCKDRKINHFFLEPSFFKDRFFYIKNSFLIPKFKFYNTFENSTKKLLKNLKSKKPLSFISIHKDRYRKALFKVFDLNNILRAFSKIFKKYFLNYHYDYEYVFTYIKQHIYMAFKSLIQRLLYQSSPEKNYIYFPLHVPNDISLSLRSRQYYDQFKFIKNLIKYIPKNYKLVIKEHPSFIGHYDFVKLNSLIRKNKNRIILVSPNINSYDLIKKADIVITINSKSGAEAIILDKPFMSFANSFYENFNGINTLKI